MFFDKYQTIVLEQNPPGDPGNYGDAFRETGSYLTLEAHVNPGVDLARNKRVREFYESCHTDKGLLRHSETIWREEHFSFDQWWGGYIAFAVHGLTDLVLEMEKYIEDRGNKTGNGNPVHLFYWTVTKRAHGKSNSFYDTPLYGQSLLLRRFPYRWSDARKEWETTKNAQADWINWYCTIVMCEMGGHTAASKIAKNSVDPKFLYTEITKYYLDRKDKDGKVLPPEPNPIVLPLYYKSICKTYGVTL